MDSTSRNDVHDEERPTSDIMTGLKPQAVTNNGDTLKFSPNDAIGGSPERPAAVNAPSPEPNCAICLGKMENKSFTDSCFHQFCFTCLLEWSKVKAECPLCKQSFKSIVHNVRSIEDYDQYHLQTENFSNFENGGDGVGTRRFRYRSTLTAERRREVALGRLLLGHSRQLTGASSMSPPSPPMPARPSPYTTSEFRRYIYENDLWARSSCRASRYREAAPNFYLANPAVTHRLVPWLNRELNALRYGQQTAFLLELIMSLLERFHIRSPEFGEHIRPYFLHETDHFVHEFFNFARSPHDMVEYDRLVTYGPSTTPTSSVSTTMGSNSAQDHDIVLVYSSSEDAVVRNRNLVGHQPVVLSRARLFLDLVSPNRTPVDYSHRPRSPIGTPIAGPSGIQNRRQAVKQEIILTDDDDDIMIIDVINPGATRKSPDIIIDISDNDDSVGGGDDNGKRVDMRAATSTSGMQSLDAPSTSRSSYVSRLSSSSDSDDENSGGTRPKATVSSLEKSESKSDHKSKNKSKHRHRERHRRKHKSRSKSRADSSSFDGHKHKRRKHSKEKAEKLKS